MQLTIVSDTSCLIALSRINQLSLLKNIYGEVFITSIVAREFGFELPEFIRIKNPSENSQQKISGLNIDEGEASAIALALETENSLLIIDELKARSVAQILGLRVTGTLGVLIEAKERGFISSIKPEIEKIKTQTNFRLGEDVIQLALKIANEK